jgi:sterol desaturase/sphingolipid hydroxylase (fatty acid hydroxylase superfamily)
MNSGHETAMRFVFFLVIFIALALLEHVFPRRIPSHPRGARWFNNLSIIALDDVLVTLLFPVLPVAFAFQARQQGWGILNQAALPEWLAVLCAVILFDFFIYLQHVLFHSLPGLWRLHMIHHTDLDFDLTTGIRFHPLEILLSMGIKLGVVYLFIVTPDMHRVHHSVIIRERNSNFGFNLSLWDRILGTYRDQPERGHEGMTIGLANYRDPGGLALPKLLILPFKKTPPY